MHVIGEADYFRWLYRGARKAARRLVESGAILPAAEEEAYRRILTDSLNRAGASIPRWLSPQPPITPSALAPAATEAEAAIVRAAATTRSATGVARTTLRAGAPVAAAFFVAESCYHLYRMHGGKIDGAECGRRIVESAASSTGGLGGATAGAALFAAAGSVVPVLGTTIGLVLGGIVGSIGGATALRAIARWFTRSELT